VEKFLLIARREHRLDARILRISNPYGPGQSLLGRQGFVAIALGCLKNDTQLLLRDHGNMVRDFIYVGDLAKAMVDCGLAEGIPAVLNIGSGRGSSLQQVLDVISEVSGKSISTESEPSRWVDIPSSVLDISLARKSISLNPSIDLSQGIRLTLRSHGLMS
jgi:UDP-glucose 4-epimerase